MTESTKSFYDQYVNLYTETLTPAMVKGAIPHPDWIICELIGPPEEMASKGGIVLSPSEVSKKTPPLIYKVLSAGTNAAQTLSLQPDDFISIQFLAGDKFLNSTVVAIHRDDVLWVYNKESLLK